MVRLGITTFFIDFCSGFGSFEVLKTFNNNCTMFNIFPKFKHDLFGTVFQLSTQYKIP